jgi:hypothetical protein
MSAAAPHEVRSDEIQSGRAARGLDPPGLLQAMKAERTARRLAWIRQADSQGPLPACLPEEPKTSAWTRAAKRSAEPAAAADPRPLLQAIAKAARE